MTPRILHVLAAPSFAGSTASVFEEAAPGRNVFVAVGFDGASLQVPRNVGIEQVGVDDRGLARLADLVAGSGVAIFHSVSVATARVLASAPSSVLRVWSGWGGDYYGTTFDRWGGLLAPASRRYRRSTVRPAFWASRMLAVRKYDPVLRAAARAADVFSAPIPEDLAVFQQRFPTFRGEYRQLNYVTLEDSIASAPRRDVGADVLLGNSASLSNNHLDVIARLARSDLEDRRVIAPLSYGDRDYAAEVARIGTALLGERFVPLSEFLPLHEYNALLGGCGVFVHGAWRQEGLGNVLRALWQGSRVVLDGRNRTVDYLRSRGVDVELLDDLQPGSHFGGPITAAQRVANEEFLDTYWSRRVVVANARRLVAVA